MARASVRLHTVLNTEPAVPPIRPPESHKPLGDDLLSQGAASQVPSALAGLTSGFGMGPGVPPPL